MRRLLTLFLFVLATQNLYAEIIGVSTRNALLQQAHLGLNIDLTNGYTLTASLLDKLPPNSSLSFVTPTFIAAWGQVSFEICNQAVNKNVVPIYNQDTQIKNWLNNFAATTWGVKPTSPEVDAAYLSGHDSSLSQLTSKQKMALSCSFVLASPKVYLIYK